MKGSAFPPSADELFAECQKRAAAEKADRDWRAAGAPKVPPLRLPPPQKHGYSLAQLADWTLVINGGGRLYAQRVDADGAPLRIPAGYPGAGQPATWGYLTPAEAEANRSSRRKAPARHFSEAAE